MAEKSFFKAWMNTSLPIEKFLSSVEEELDDLKSANDILRHTARCSDENRQHMSGCLDKCLTENERLRKELTTAMQVFGFTKQQILDAWGSVGHTFVIAPSQADALALALSPKWLDFDSQSPNDGQTIYLWHEQSKRVESSRWVAGRCARSQGWTKWQQRYVPMPPVEEESELVKALIAHAKTTNAYGEINRVIEIVKKYEKERINAAT